MRAINVLLILALALGGCINSEGSASDSTNDAPASPADDPPSADQDGTPPDPSGEGVGETAEILILEGTLTWHSQETQDSLAPATQAVQTAFNSCVETGGDGTEVWMTNLNLGSKSRPQPVAEGTDRIQVTFDWEQTDYLKDRLVLAYRQAGHEVFTESDWVYKGEPTVIDTEPSTREGRWAFWACVSQAGETTNQNPVEGPKPFVGDLTFRLTVPPA